METLTFVLVGVVAIGALVSICLLLKMIVSGDYSLILEERKELSQISPGTASDSHHLDAVSTSFTPKPAASERQLVIGTLDIAVAHFANDVREWKTPEERIEFGKELERIRELDQPESETG